MKIKNWIIFIFILLIIIFFGKNLNPFSKEMFEFHDITQPARIQQFTLNLKNLKIPPRLAPDLNYKLGYPVFNFYAPFSYWLTSSINLLGFDVINSIKISFMVSLILAFVFSFLFLNLFFDFYPALFGAILYITASYFPVDIFVRGNLAETWFLALFPLSLYLLYKNSLKVKPFYFFLTTIVLFFIFTTHNLLSIVFIPLSLVFALILNNKKLNILAIILALLLSSYYLIPLFLENYLTIAREMAIQTRYQDHFLCLWQLWNSPWGYGGSIPGCNDGMSFKLGKPQVIFSLLGIIIFLINLLKRKKTPYLLTTSYLLLLLISSLFVTLYQSRPIWDLLSSILAIFQFPWRFVTFSLIGLVFFSAYFWQNILFYAKKYRRTINFLIFFIALGIIFLNAKYFRGKSIAKIDFVSKYLSRDYIEKESALRIPEYFSNINYKKSDTSFKEPYEFTLPYVFIEKTNPAISEEVNKPYYKKFSIPFSSPFWINVNYFPYWEIKLNNKVLEPNKDFTFSDNLNRPLINSQEPATVEITYKQTYIEKFGNLLSLFSLMILIYIIKVKSLWKKLTK